MGIMPLEAKRIELSFMHKDGRRIVAYTNVTKDGLTHIAFHTTDGSKGPFATSNHDEIHTCAFLKQLTCGMTGKKGLRAEVFSAVHEALVKSGHVNEGSIAEGKLKLLSEYKSLTPEARE